MIARRQLLAACATVGGVASAGPAASAALRDWAESWRVIRRFQASKIPIGSFSVSSPSMLPTLAVADVVLADLRATGTLPRWGDLVVFRHGANVEWIKRVVGLPGDSVSFVDQALLLNDETRTAPEATASRFARGREQQRVALHLETGRSGVSYEVAFGDPPEFPPLANTRPIVVPPGYLFVVGDNRDRSLDSRATQFGLVRLGDVVGRLVYRLRPNADWLVPPASVPGLLEE